MQIKVEIPEEKKEVKEPVKEFVPEEEDIAVQSVASLFDFKPSDIQKNIEKLQLLAEYGRKIAKSDSPDEIKWAIRSLPTTKESPDFSHGECQS
ncbi:MAG: hypothetical protein KatS3mg101_0980 [Patescibacteria group bacterium]|nr:MAG: hypothetical protein KatS3mg101_0980 [Patescibacteria group bacterium]